MKRETYTPKEGDIVIGIKPTNIIVVGIFEESNNCLYYITNKYDLHSELCKEIYPYSIDKLHELMKEHLGYENTNNFINKEFIEDKHDELRAILIKYNNPEFGDCIIDEICSLFNYPTTIFNESPCDNHNCLASHTGDGCDGCNENKHQEFIDTSIEMTNRVHNDLKESLIEHKQGNTFETLDGVIIRKTIDKCYSIDLEDKMFNTINDGKGNVELLCSWIETEDNKDGYVNFANKQKADVYLHWLKGGKVEYNGRGWIKPGFDIDKYTSSHWTNYDWRIVEEAKTFKTIDGYDVTFQDNGWSKDSLEAIDENKNHSIGYLSCTNPDFVYFQNSDKANIFLQALNGKTIQIFIHSWSDLSGTFNYLKSLDWTLEYRVKPNIATTRDGVEVEINDNNLTIDRLWFVYNDDGNIEHDYVIIGSLDALNTFHSKAKAELFAEGVKGKQLQVIESNMNDDIFWDKYYNDIDWSLPIECIRIKPTNTYVPYTTCNFDLYGKKIVSKDGSTIDTIITISNNREMNFYYKGGSVYYSNKQLFDEFLIDGLPIGNKQ